MPLFEKHEQTGAGAPRSTPVYFVIAPLRWREPCVKIILIGNLFFATTTYALIGLSAALRPSVKVAESKFAQITGQIKIPCNIGQHTLLYGFNFFTIIRNTYIANGVICRDIKRGKWVWQFEESRFSAFNSN